MQEPFFPVLRVCWLKGGWVAEAVQSCWIQLAWLQPPLRGEGRTALCAASSAPQVSQTCPFLYFVSLLLCVSDHHLTGSVNVIQLV